MDQIPEVVTCGICLEEEDVRKCFRTTECGHAFDKPCMDKYVDVAQKEIEKRYHETDDEDRPNLEMRVPCPICRTPLDDEQFVALKS